MQSTIQFTLHSRLLLHTDYPMPTYDYVCDACDHKFELFQSITDPVKRKCPKCGKSKLRRLIGAGAAIMFKGSGFYKTDYRSDSYKKHAEADKPSDVTTESKSDTANRSKTETKSIHHHRTRSETEKPHERKEVASLVGSAPKRIVVSA